MIRLRELREMKGIQQKELAIDIGVSQPTISDWESGRKTPSSQSSQKLADYFSVSVDYLLGRISNDPFSRRLRDRLAFELSSTDSADIEAAIENGFPYDELTAKSEASHPLTLAEACDAAFKMGTSLSNLLGEDEDDYYDETFGKLPHDWPLKTKKAPGTDESAPRDSKVSEIIELLVDLDDSQKDFLIAFLETIAAKNQRRHPTALVSGEKAAQVSERPDLT